MTLFTLRQCSLLNGCSRWWTVDGGRYLFLSGWYPFLSEQCLFWQVLSVWFPVTVQQLAWPVIPIVCHCIMNVF